MANGFKALRHVGGGVQRLSGHSMASGYTSNIFSGDLVTLNAGNVEVAVEGTTPANVLGTFIGCMYVDAKNNQVFSPNWVANTVASDITALVSDDKGVSYKVSATAALTVGATYDMDTAVAGNAATGQSGQQIDQATTTQGHAKVLSEIDATNFIYEVQLQG